MSEDAKDYPVKSVKFENPIPLESWMLEKSYNHGTQHYSPEPEKLTDEEQWVDAWLYRNCFEHGWGMNEPSRKQLVQMAKEFNQKFTNQLK